MRAFDAVSVTRVPQFIQDDYPALNEFVEAYYEWLTETQINRADFKSIRDIDKTLDEYLVYFKNTLAKGIPDNTAAEFRTVVKNIRSMFKAKGTEKSIKFFFKALFNEEVDIFYPRTQMFIPSDSTWVRSRILKLEIGSKDASAFIGKELTFGNGSLYVSDGYKVGSVAVLSVSDIVGNIESVSSVFLGEEQYQIKKQVVKAVVKTPGNNFSPNANYTLQHGVVVSVKETIRGSVNQIDVISGGTGYVGDEEIIFVENGPYGKTLGRGGKAIIESVGVGGTIESVILLDGGSLYDLPPGVIVESTSGEDAILRATGNLGGLKHLQVIDGGFDLPETPWQETIGGAVIEMVYGNVAELDGTFYETIGFVSSNSSYIQDEHYYQYFSYVVRTGINLDQYATIMKQIIHPAGMKMFSAFTISTAIQTLAKFKQSELVIDLFSKVHTDVNVVDNIFTLYISTLNQSGGLKRNQIDVFKYKWFKESTYINRFKDSVIRGYCSEANVNPDYKKNTNFQPDLNVVLVDVNATAGFGDSIGNVGIGNANVG